MKVYVALQQSHFGTETIDPAFTSEEDAKAFIQRRVGAKCEWTEHDAHGHYWSEARGLYRIDELELINSRQAKVRS